MRSKTSKRTVRKSSQPAAPTIDPVALTQVYQWIVQGQTQGHIADAIRSKWPDQDSQPLIVAALQQVESAADFNPKRLRGWCLEAYRDLHRQLTAMGDFVGAIRAVAKIEAILKASKDDPPPDPDADQTNQDEAEARAHLAPLFPDGDSLPLPELARLAASKILNT